MNAVAEALERLTSEAVESNRLKREENARLRREEDEASYQRAREELELERAQPSPGLSFGASARRLPFLAEVYGTKVPAANVKVAAHPDPKRRTAAVDCRCGESLTVPYDRATPCDCGRSFVFDGVGVRVATARVGALVD